jgi:hypothetical protein
MLDRGRESVFDGLCEITLAPSFTLTAVLVAIAFTACINTDDDR